MTIGTGGLKPRERRFIPALYETYNPTQAALDIGYKKGVARREGKRLVEKLAIHIEEYGKAIMAAAQVSNIRVLQELSLIAFHNPANMVDERDELFKMKDLGESGRCVRSIKHIQTKDGYRKEYVFYSKLEALELLAKAGSLFSDGAQATVVNFYMGDSSEAAIDVTPESEYLLPPPEETA